MSLSPIRFNNNMSIPMTNLLLVCIYNNIRDNIHKNDTIKSAIKLTPLLFLSHHSIYLFLSNFFFLFYFHRHTVKQTQLQAIYRYGKRDEGRCYARGTDILFAQRRRTKIHASTVQRAQAAQERFARYSQAARTKEFTSFGHSRELSQ